MRIGPSSGARVLALAAAGALLTAALVSTGVVGALPQMHSANPAASDGAEPDDAVVVLAGGSDLQFGSFQAWALLLAWLATPLLAGLASIRGRY